MRVAKWPARISPAVPKLPATEWIIETSNASAGSSSGNRPGKRWASIDLPAPGGPTISRL